MNTNVTLFRGNVAAPARSDVRANIFQANSRFDLRSTTELQVPVREVLTAVWRTNPDSGRLECSWTAEQGAATDEGVSCSDSLRRAA
jgi:hypothetical protein